MKGQSGPSIASQAAQVEADDAIVVLDQCFPFCSEPPPPPPPPPPVPFSGRVVESSSPDFGHGINAGVPGASVFLYGSASGVISLSTDGSGNYSGIYQPPSDPTVFATKWGVSSSSCCASSTMTLYTDVVTKLGLAANSAPAASGTAFTIAGAANGTGGASTSKPLYIGYATPIVIPRNPAGGYSTINVTSVDSPRFTWFGDSPISLSQSGPTGGYAGGAMSVRAMHKYIKVVLTFITPGGTLPVPTDTTLYSYNWNAVTYPPNGAAVYDHSGLFGLPTAYGPGNVAVAQSNPSAPGAQSEYVISTGRLGTAAVPYEDKFKLHVDSRQMESDWSNGNEDVILDDNARITGVIYKTIKLVLKDIAK